MIELCARKIPTKDKAFNNWLIASFSTRYKAAQGIAPYYDVEIARDKSFKHVICVIRWDKKSKPDKRNKYITLNCFKYRLKWI